jgi:hypothetical protein
MKKTFWQPLLLSVIFGLLAGITMISGLSFMISGTEASNAVGFYLALFQLSAALGGPVAGAITSTICVFLVAWFGPIDMKQILSDPVTLWSNILVTGTLLVVVGLSYRLIFERVKMLARLLPWAGIVIVYYVVQSPILISLQFYISGGVDLFSTILISYRTYIPQAIFDICFTSLVFIALPARFRKPLWYESKKALEPIGSGTARE